MNWLRLVRTRRDRLRIYLVVIGTALLSFHRFLFLGNFAVVEPGRVYRSAQPKGELERTLRDYGIASVLNLRGGSMADWWYANEVSTARRLGVDYYDLPLLADRRPSRAEIGALLDLFERCRYPLLIHCKSGSDRTGLAVSLYRLVARGEPPERALGGFSLWRGHLPVLGFARLHEPLDEYAAWLKRTGASHTPARFREWLDREYVPIGPPVMALAGPRRSR